MHKVDFPALLAQAASDGIQKLVVGAYIVRGGKILFVRRCAGETFLPGHLDLPSGGVDDGETLVEALIREVTEETGLAVQSIDRYINNLDYMSSSGKKARQFNFAVTIADPLEVVLNPAEHDSYCWVTPTEEGISEHFGISDAYKPVILEAGRILSSEGASCVL